MKGFFEIGIYRGKTEENIGTLWRSAFQLGASGIFTIGRRYSRQCSDTCNAPASIPLRDYPDFESMLAARPSGAQLVGVEMGGSPLREFRHPERAIYVLGAEDAGLPTDVLRKCQHVISIESVRFASYNVAVAGSIVMYDRCCARD